MYFWYVASSYIIALILVFLLFIVSYLKLKKKIKNK